VTGLVWLDRSFVSSGNRWLKFALLSIDPSRFAWTCEIPSNRRWWQIWRHRIRLRRIIFHPRLRHFVIHRHMPIDIEGNKCRSDSLRSLSIDSISNHHYFGSVSSISARSWLPTIVLAFTLTMPR
jgi:hypothetical protein